MNSTLHEIYAGNIGKVISTNSFKEAKFSFLEYSKLSKAGYGRISGEKITWFKNGEVYKEFIPTISEDIL